MPPSPPQFSIIAVTKSVFAVPEEARAKTRTNFACVGYLIYRFRKPRLELLDFQVRGLFRST